jgi:hypothetical protein
VNVVVLIVVVEDLQVGEEIAEAIVLVVDLEEDIPVISAPILAEPAMEEEKALENLILEVNSTVSTQQKKSPIIRGFFLY